MKKTIHKRTISIQKRFFKALDFAIESGASAGLKEFCEMNDFNRTKYSRLKNDIDKPIEDMTYKSIDVDALACLCDDFGVSAEWLLLGKGNMFK